MAKKTSTKTKPTATAKPKAKPTAKEAVKEKAVVPAAKPKKATAKPVAKKAAPKKPAYTADDIALRAYFIAEKRNQSGIPGDPHQDWVEAEKQLAAEARGVKKPKAKKA